MTYRAKLLGACFLLWLVPCAGCSDNHPGEVGVCSGTMCPESCLDLEGANCDIRDGACQDRIFHAVECVRGTPGTRPRIDLRTEAEIRDAGEFGAALVQALSGEDASDGGSLAADAGVDGGSEPPEGQVPDAGNPDARDAGEREGELDAGLRDAGEDDAGSASDVNSQRWDVGLALLRLRVPHPSTDEVDQLAGYYSHETRSIALVDRGSPLDSEAVQQTLAHEFVHALQDQEFGLTELRRGRTGTTDTSLALGCLIEGEAVLYEELAWGLLSGLPVDQAYWDVRFGRRSKYARDAVSTADSPYDSAWLLRYGVGVRYLADAWLLGGNAQVARLFDAPPSSTVQWMHGLAEAQTRSTPLALPLHCDDATAPAGFAPIGTDTFGAFILYGFLAHNLVLDGLYPTEASWQRALEWRQDRVALFADEAEHVALSWRIRFADAAVTAEVQAALSQTAMLPLRVLLHGDELEILASDARDVLPAWPGTNCGAP